MADDRTSSRTRRTTVIVGVDGSEEGLRAARYAAGSAIRRDADLIVLHAVDDAAVAGAWGVVYDPTALQDAGQVVVDDAINVAKGRGIDPDRISGEVVLGNPAAILADRSSSSSVVAPAPDWSGCSSDRPLWPWLACPPHLLSSSPVRRTRTRPVARSVWPSPSALRAQELPLSDSDSPRRTTVAASYWP